MSTWSRSEPSIVALSIPSEAVNFEKLDAIRNHKNAACVERVREIVAHRRNQAAAQSGKGSREFEEG